jgi:pimeloyl-ACP methyl ester carboxylesterase
MRWFNDLQRVSTSGENAAKVMAESAQIDVLSILGEVDVLTLVIHARDDAQVPFEQGRQLAALIPGSRFVPLESSNHLILVFEPGWGSCDRRGAGISWFTWSLDGRTNDRGGFV